MKNSIERCVRCVVGVLAISLLGFMCEPTPALSAWTVGTPIVTYYAGPALTDANAQQMAAGGWNLVWARTAAELDVAYAHNLRAMWAGSLDDATIKSIRDKPALYNYYVADEPSVTYVANARQNAWFTDQTVNGVVEEGLASIVSRLKGLDLNHPAYINLYPTYASSAQLGAADYPTYLSEYMSIVKPELLSYDNYQFFGDFYGDGSGIYGDRPDYFKNMAIISHTAKQAGIPFLNIVQACSWSSYMRVPTGDELRYLYNTSLAYGAAGVSDFVYREPGFAGGMANADGTTTTLYNTAKTINPEFVAVGEQVQSMKHIGAYHLGDLPPGYGTTDGSSPMRLPSNSPFTLSGIPDSEFVDWNPVKGALLGLWGLTDNLTDATRALVVNLDYVNHLTTRVTGPGNLSVFDPLTGRWIAQNHAYADLNLEPGGSFLVGLTSAVPEPTAMVLLITGMFGLLAYAWRKRK